MHLRDYSATSTNIFCRKHGALMMGGTLQGGPTQLRSATGQVQVHSYAEIRAPQVKTAFTMNILVNKQKPKL